MMNVTAAFGLLAVLASISNSLCEEKPTVHLSPGVEMQGEKQFSSKYPERSGYAYYGIRYGTARRFEHSTENTDFGYLQDPAHPKQGFACPQSSAAIGLAEAPQALAMDEDCLYLDIFVPSTAKTSQRLLPVMVFIYGGAFQIGNKDECNGTFLALETDAVYVALNYRVSIFGFLSTGDENLPGNYGVGDCKTALNWIVKHIEKFSGDVNQITVFGQSAGAILTSTLYMDPESRERIRAALALSGSILMDNALKSDPKPVPMELAEKVNCTRRSTREMVHCLKDVPVSVLLQAAKKLEPGNPETIPYGLVVDHVHIKELPRLALKHAGTTSKKSTLISGYLREDNSALLGMSYPQLFDPAVPVTYGLLKEIVARHFIPTSDRCTTLKYDQAERAMNYYSISETDERSEMMRKVILLSTDAVWGYPPMKELSIYAQNMPANGGENQFYLISFDQKFMDYGAFHGLDMLYIFGDELNKLYYQLPFNATVQTSLLTMMRQIVHNGRMDGPAFNREGAHLELPQKGLWELGHTDVRARVKFWDSVADTPCPKSESRLYEREAFRSSEEL
ncbi:bile salt-activated lipase-like [Paramacrobiotus metropolitanus]|uniref:bile salt-activated lipase-like n=1 Tax=Paramacrobiotus metropolitanus TaxID=2943436 RepID=UPI00244597AE|nr:bile salt-activated lipase-like [Paramacrobiotus metropolitanus]